MRYLLGFALLPFILTLSVKAQYSFNFEGDIATDTQNKIFIYSVDFSAGYTFIKKDFLTGGIKFQKYNLIPRYDIDTNDTWSTTSIYNFMFFSGYKYMVPVFRILKGSNREKIIGVSPEFRVYFNPFVPHKIHYISEDGLLISKGKYNVQLASGLGFGIYFASKDGNGYFVLRFEYSSIDAFKTLRKLEYKNKEFDFPTDRQFSVGLSVIIK